MARIARHLSYANVTASLALFVALGGISWAAVALPRNSVGAKQLKKNAVTAPKIKRNAVTSAKVKDGSLQRGEFASGTLLQGPQGPQGLQGPKGDPGQNGAPGERGEPGTARAFVFVNPNCAGPTGACPFTMAKNVLGAQRVGLGDYCVQVAAGIDKASSVAAAEVDIRRTDPPEGNATAMSTSDSGVCGASEFLVATRRLPTGGTIAAAPANDVGFWLLVP
jgi:hypothetical protein